MSVLMDFAIFPTDQGVHVSGSVSKVVAQIKESGFPYQLTAMGTLVETTSVAEALKIVEQAAELLQTESSRLYCTIKLDIKKGAHNMMEEKVLAVTEKLKPE
jgi:uncharacterized protein (TIGR00106 family)